jgi:glycosyltransferase involved in cell wall biosynthesis
MRIVHLSTSDTLGGASIAAHAIHRGLSARGIESSMVVRLKATNDPFVRVQSLADSSIFRNGARLLSRLAARCTKYQRNSEGSAFSYLSGVASAYRFNAESLLPADLIQINWVSDFLDWWSFFSKPPSVPLVWRLADMSPFTGLCHYSDGCDRFKSLCHSCPQAAVAGVKDTSESTYRTKHKLMDRLDEKALTIVCQSEWMAGLVSESPILGRFPRHVIRNGVNTRDFWPIDKTEARTGWQTVESVSDRRLLRLIYSACDLMAFPSIEDNCPNAVIESIACGTPVLAFDGSGTEEIITRSQGGWTTPCRDFKSFVDYMGHLIADSEEVRDRQAKCIAGIKAGFEFETMIDNYVAVYHDALGRFA